MSEVTYMACPPPCLDGRPCREEVLCTPETCPGGWEHRVHCIKHICAHDFRSGPWIEIEGGGTATCKCGMTAIGHDMRYGRAVTEISEELLDRIRLAFSIYAARNAHNSHPENFRGKDNGWRMIMIRVEDHEFILETMRELG